MAQVVSVLRRSKCSKFKSPGMGKITPTKAKEQSYFRHVFQEATTDWSKMIRTKLVTVIMTINVDNEVCKPAVLKKWSKQYKRKRSLVCSNFELNSLFDFICILPNVSFRNFNRTLSLFPTL